MSSLRSVANAKLFRTSNAVHEQNNIFAFSFRVGILYYLNKNTNSFAINYYYPELRLRGSQPTHEIPAAHSDIYRNRLASGNVIKLSPKGFNINNLRLQPEVINKPKYSIRQLAD